MIIGTNLLKSSSMTTTAEAMCVSPRIQPRRRILGTGLWFTPVLPHGEFAEAMRGLIV
jgi:hypothetical protein